MNETDVDALSGDVLDEMDEITIAELCSTCSVDHSLIDRLVEEGILDPIGERPEGLRFRYSSVRRIRTVTRLQKILPAIIRFQIEQFFRNELWNLGNRLPEFTVFAYAVAAFNASKQKVTVNCQTRKRSLESCSPLCVPFVIVVNH